MPFVENQGVKIYWDEQGSGEPLLLIMGLSYPSYMWHRSRPVLAQTYRTIARDHLGVGQSDVPPGVYSIALMARTQPRSSMPLRCRARMYSVFRWGA
jgi:pimeloyl-ACP methyl ester carboxylesterase